MKRIETIIRTDVFPEVRSALESINVYSLNKHDISGNLIINNSKKGVFLSKIEVITGNDNYNKVINTIAKYAEGDGKIFVSDVGEVINVKTFENDNNVEKTESVTSKRSRLVPLQKYTMLRAEKFYVTYKDILRTKYRIRSYSDFINYCVIAHLSIIEEEIKSNNINIIESHDSIIKK